MIKVPHLLAEEIKRNRRIVLGHPPRSSGASDGAGRFDVTDDVTTSAEARRKQRALRRAKYY